MHVAALLERITPSPTTAIYIGFEQLIWLKSYSSKRSAWEVALRGAQGFVALSLRGVNRS